MPSPEWKKRQFSRREDQVWFPGETVITGIGQGFMLVTPLQLAHAEATLAANGVRHQPRLLIGTEDAVTRETRWADPKVLPGVDDSDPDHWQTVHDAMVGVTTELHGTARLPMKGTNYTVAGKTGTAQVFTVAQDEKYHEEDVDERLRDHGLFVAYAPADAPSIAVAVIVENGGGGSRAAAPVARKILDAYFASQEYVARRALSGVGRAAPAVGPRVSSGSSWTCLCSCSCSPSPRSGSSCSTARVAADTGLLLRQVLRFTVGLAAFLVLSQVPPRYLRMWTPWAFFLGLGLLIAVMVEGEIGKGAQRWLDLGIVRFQPSELMKLAAPMMVAWFMHDRRLPPTFVHLVATALIVIVPALLIAEQPDLGTAMLVIAAGGLTILLAGVSLRMITALGLLALGTIPIVWAYMRDYQRARVLTFLNPESDPLGTGYNIIQSKIAIGSGGLFGKGWLKGTQAHLEFLPERSTDFIFAVMAEEFGLLGLLLLLTLYVSLVGRGLYIAGQAQETYTRLLAGALSLTFFFYVFVNAGMVSGLLPIVGVPLPLVSAGGTSMVTLMAGFGMLAAIHKHRKLLAP